MIRWFPALAPALLVSLAGPAQADPQGYARDVRSWQAHDARLVAIGWRLARANAQFCAQRQSAIGLMLTDFRRFAAPADVSAALGIASGVALEAVATGSPAEAAGLRAGDALLAIGGAAVPAPSAPLPKGKRLADVMHDRLDSELASRGSVTLQVAAAGGAPRSVIIAGVPVCRARFALLSTGTAAMSEGYEIKIAVQLMVESPSDDEAATILAHELAHNALNHVAANNAAGRNYLTVRRHEREADRLAPWLMANAGYDPAAAPRFIAAWGPRHGGGITRSQSHDDWHERAADMSGQLPLITQLRSNQPGQLLDWRKRFAAAQPQ